MGRTAVGLSRPPGSAKFLCIILIALIATPLDLLTEVFRTISGRPAIGGPPSQETQPQMRAGYGS
jgi:hypothetical protein